MVLADIFQNIFMKTRISDVKYFFRQSLMVPIKKNKNGCSFRVKIAVKMTLFLNLKCYSGYKNKYNSTKSDDFSKNKNSQKTY